MFTPPRCHAVTGPFSVLLPPNANEPFLLGDVYRPVTSYRNSEPLATTELETRLGLLTGGNRGSCLGRSADTGRLIDTDPMSLTDPSSKRRPEGATPGIAPHGLVARMSGDGPGDSWRRGFWKPASSSQAPISSKEKVSPCWVLTSMLTAKKSPLTGPVRSLLTRNS